MRPVATGVKIGRIRPLLPLDRRRSVKSPVHRAFCYDGGMPMPRRRVLLLLHAFHGLIVVYLLACLAITYRAAWLATFDTWTLIAVVSLCVEGYIVFVLNNGDCPLIYLQRRLDDETPFFALFMPKAYAKLVIPVAGLATIIGLLALLIRLGYR